MPTFVAAAAIVGGIAGTVGATIAAGTLVLGFSATAFATALILGGLQMALAPDPAENRSSFADGGSLVTLRQAAGAWQIVYGRRRVGGVITFAELSEDASVLHLVITFAAHRCEAVSGVYLDHRKLSLDADGYAGGRWIQEEFASDAGIVPGSPYQVVLGGTVSSVDRVMLSEVGEGGGEYPLVDVSPNAPTSAAQYSVSGNTVTFHSSAEGKPYSISYLDGSAENSAVRCRISLGDEGSAQPFPELVAESRGLWTSAHRQEGHCKIWLRLEYNGSLFPQGIPNITAVVDGVCDVYDPRSETYGWTDNEPLIRAHYLTNTRFGLGASYDEQIGEDELIAAANEADELVEQASGGSEKRYTADGSFTTDQLHEEILTSLAAASAGSTVHVGARWNIYVGGYEAPTLELTEEDLAGPIAVQALVSAREGCNSVSAEYSSRADRYQTRSAPALVSDAYITLDNGEQRWQNLDLRPFVVRPWHAQRLMKIFLFRARQGLSFAAPFKLKALRALTGKTVALTIPRYGWNAKPFEVGSFGFEVQPGSGKGGPRLVISLGGRETAAAVYDWAVSEEQWADLGPNTNLEDPLDVNAPGAPTITESLDEPREGRGVRLKLTMAWTASSYPFGLQYQPEYKLASASEWIVLPLTAGLTADILDVRPEVYDFRVRANSVLGPTSEYATSAGVEVFGVLEEAPANATIRGLQTVGNLALLSIDQSPDMDVRAGGRVLVRHTEATSAQLWEESFSIGEAEGYPGSSTIIALPLKPGSYGVRFQRASPLPGVPGTQSETPAWIDTKQASVLSYATTDTLQEDSSFPGVAVQTVAVDGVLKLDATGTIDDIVDIDEHSSIDDTGGSHVSGTYYFSGGFDFGSVSEQRVTGEIRGLAVNTNDLIDDRADPIDTWLDFDGDSGGGSVDAWLEMRETDSATEDVHVLYPGSGTAYAFRPDGADVSITGDIDIRVKVAMNDWTPSETKALLIKGDTATELSYRLLVNTAGGLYMDTSVDGTVATLVATNSTVAVGAADGSTIWVRATRDVDNGAGGSTTNYYTSTDYNPYLGTGTWTPLGSSVVVAGATSIFDSTSSIRVGSFGGAGVVSGKVYYAEILNGINGEVVERFDPKIDAEDPVEEQTSWTSRLSDELWTLVAVDLVNPFSDWKRLDAHEVVARRMDFRLQLEADDPAYNMHIDTLRVTAEAVV